MVVVVVNRRSADNPIDSVRSIDDDHHHHAIYHHYHILRQQLTMMITSVLLLLLILNNIDATGAAEDDNIGGQQQQAERNFYSFLNGAASADRRPPAAQQNLFSSINWHQVIERLFEVRCGLERMRIVMHYTNAYSRLAPTVVEVLKNARLYTADAPPSRGHNWGYNGNDDQSEEEPGGKKCTSNSAQSRDAAAAGGGEKGVVVLALDYDDCGVQMGRADNYTVQFTTTVIVEASFNITLTTNQDDQQHFVDSSEADAASDDGHNHDTGGGTVITRRIKESYQFRCVHPSNVADVALSPSFRLHLSDEKFPKTYWTYPHTIEIGKLVYLYSEASLSWYKETGVYSFPVNCWTSGWWTGSSSTNSADHRQQRRRRDRRKQFFLKDGCPVNDHRGRGLAHTHHFKQGPTKVSFYIGPYLLPPTTSGGGITEIGLTCEVLPCTHAYTTGLINIPKCPVSYYCAGNPQISHVLPVSLRQVRRIPISAGPLKVQLKDEIKTTTKSVGQALPDCRMACKRSQALTTTGDSSNNNWRSKQQKVVASKIYIDGVKTQIVVLVAFVSFAFGFLVMGGLWWIHNRTDPRRLKSHSNRQEDDDNPTIAPGGSNNNHEPAIVDPRSPSTITTTTAVDSSQRGRVFRLGRRIRSPPAADPAAGDFSVAGGSCRRNGSIISSSSTANSIIRTPAAAPEILPLATTTPLLHRFMADVGVADQQVQDEEDCRTGGSREGSSSINVDALAARRLLNTLR